LPGRDVGHHVEHRLLAAPLAAERHEIHRAADHPTDIVIEKGSEPIHLPTRIRFVEGLDPFSADARFFRQSHAL
jgi:hypothetical protein